MKRRFEQLLRPAFEARAAVAWAGAGMWMLGCAIVFAAPRPTLLASAGLAFGMCAMRGMQAHRLLKFKLALCGKEVSVWPAAVIKKNMPRLKDNLWMGWGYRWEPRHTQRAYEISKRDLDDVYPPKWWLKLIKKKDPRLAKGNPWIHGLNMGESDVLLPFDALKGHCAVIATTGAIKTVLARLIISQLAMRGDVCIVIDPKGDKDLREICRQAAEQAGHPERFLMLHPAFASKSVRLDLLKNWDQVSVVASRLTMVLESEDSTFVQFCWRAIHSITSGMKFIGKRVSLYNLKMAMESSTAVENLAEQALERFFTMQCPQFLEVIEKEKNALAGNASKATKGSKQPIENVSPKLGALIKVFLTQIPETSEEAFTKGLPIKPDEITGLVTILGQNREWFSKMIVSMTPLLTKLTTDDLRGLLSPDYEDINDPRPIMDGKRIVEGGHIMYVGTDTLADETVGKAVASILLAELSSVAAEIYNHGIEDDLGKPQRRIHVLVDEWGDAMCSPLIQQANKGRGAGFFIWAMGQTFSDLVDRFGGDTAKARRFLGNMNNMIIGATQDPDTMDLIIKKLGETSINIKSVSAGMGSKTEDAGLEFSSNQSTSISERQVEIFPRALLPTLPDLHYVGFFNRGELIKGRIPVVTSTKT